MVYENSHLSDHDLLLAADGELPARRRNEVTAHLQACWSCRTRMAEVEKNIGNFMGGYHALLDGELPPGSNSGALLRGRLVQESERLSRNRFDVVFNRWRNFAAAVCLAALMIYVAGAILWHKRNQELIVPNPSLTPGEATFASKREVCQASFPAGSGEIPEALKQAVFAEYGMRNAPRDAYEVDFLITPGLGGAASIRNLWPQPYTSRVWNARVKDALEDRLRSLVCDGDLDLSTAQHEIATNWVNAYKKYVRPDKPM
jgi:hypothetical protein